MDTVADGRLSPSAVPCYFRNVCAALYIIARVQGTSESSIEGRCKAKEGAGLKADHLNVDPSQDLKGERIKKRVGHG